MLENLLGKHSDDISSLLSNQFGLQGEQSSQIGGIIQNVISGFVKDNAASPQASGFSDLFNPQTANTENPLFSKISDMLKNSLSNQTNLNSDQVSNISSTGLDSIISMVSNGALKNLDVMSIIGSLIGGQSSANSGSSGLVGGLFKKLLGGLFSK